MIRKLHLILVVLAVSLAGCAAYLDKVDPAHKGQTMTQVGDVIKAAATQPVVQTAAAVASPAYGNLILGLLAGAGGLIVAADQALRHAKDHNALKAIDAESDKTQHAIDVASAVVDAIGKGVQAADPGPVIAKSP